MVIPIGHEESEVRRTPVVTFAILALCALAMLATGGGSEATFARFGLRPEDPRLLSFLTHMFLHAGWLHLLGNGFMLYLAGPALEDRWGRPLFAAFYLSGGIFAAAFFLAADDGALPMVGASGAIAAVLGAFWVRHHRTQIRFLYVFFVGFRLLRGTFETPAWVALAFWLGNELLSAWISRAVGVQGGVAYWAHVGGFAFGAGAALALRFWRIEERYLAPALEARVTTRSSAAVEQALQLREAGDLEGAFALLEDTVRRRPLDPDASLAFWDVAAALGRTPAALPAFTRTLRALAKEHPATAARHWLELCAHAPDERLDPATLLAIHAALPPEERDAAALALRHAADARNRELTPALALRVLDAARGVDTVAAAAALRFALSSPHMPLEKKQRLEAQLAALEAEAQPAEPPREREPQAPGGGPVPIDIGPIEDDDPTRAREEHEGAADGSADIDALERHLAELAGPRFAGVKLTEAVPVALAADGVEVKLAGGRVARIPYAKIQAVAVAAVAGLAPKPVLVIDLVANWTSFDDQALRAVRLRSDRFDPRRLDPGAPSPTEALRRFVERLLAQSGATALPAPEAARGRPFARFPDVAAYEREVLSVG